MKGISKYCSDLMQNATKRMDIYKHKIMFSGNNGL